VREGKAAISIGPRSAPLPSRCGHDRRRRHEDAPQATQFTVANKRTACRRSEDYRQRCQQL